MERIRTHAFQGYDGAVPWKAPVARIFYELLSRDHETGNPLAGLSGLSRRSFSEDGSAASAKKMGVPPGNRRVLVLRRTSTVRSRGRHPRTPGRTAISVVTASHS